MGDRLRAANRLCVTSHPGQLSLLPTAGLEISTGDAVQLGSKDSRGSFHL